jgi:DNA-binding CsgD family transcriptional regulator
MLALELGDALFGLAHPRDAIEIYQRGAEAVGAQDERLRVHLLAQAGLAALAAQGDVKGADPLIAGVIEAARRSRAADDRAALSLASISAFWLGAGAEVCVPLAERALAAEPYAAGIWDWTPDLTFLLVVLAFCDAYEQRDACLDQAIDRAQNQLAPVEILAYARWRSFGRMRQGRIAEAEADARLAMRPLELLARGQSATAMYTAALIPPLVARGALGEAEQILAACPVDEIDDIDVLLLLEARAELRTAQRRLADARADLERLHAEAENRRMNCLGANTSSADLAILLHATGEATAARALAAEHLARARAFGAPSAVGHALRACGTVAPGMAALEHLEEAVTVLAGTPARLEHAQALLALGSAKRRLGQRRAAIDLLGQALDLASRCGATPLVAVSRTELQLAGARPRRERLWGREALTAAELRVATLAAHGASNAEIAQELVVTRRTVETHLTHMEVWVSRAAVESVVTRGGVGLG